MARLTRKQAASIERVLRHLVRGREYVNREDIAVCRRDRIASTTLHYQRDDGSSLYEVERAYGSDLCALETAETELRQFLVSHTQGGS